MTKTELVRAWFDGLWHRGVESTIDDILAPGVVAHGLGAEDIVGPDQFRDFYRAFRSAFPTVRVNLVHVLESGDYAVCQVDAAVTAADGAGPFHFPGSCTVRIQNGQFVEAWNNFDFLSLLTQMGAVRPDAMSTALASVASTAH